MKKLISTLLVAIGVIIIPLGLQSNWEYLGKVEAAIQEWVFLGERTVGDNVDHDTIIVTAARGDFHRLKFTVRDQAIKMLHMVVTYGNGNSDKIETRYLIPAGGESRPIDLRGDNRVIKKVEFWYETKSLGKNKARIRVYAER